jgi:hypothetical protein
MPKRPVVFALAAWLAVGPVLSAAPPAEPDLAAGIRQVEEGDYSAAVITLDRAARQLASQKDRGHDLARAYLYLGIAYVGLGSETSARARFRDALAQSQDLRLDPEQFPPKVIELFEKARDENRVPAASAPAAAGTVAAAPAPQPSPEAKKGKSKTPYLLIGLGGAAAAGVALAAGGGGDSGGAASTSGPPATVPSGNKTETFNGAVSGNCQSDTVSYRVVPSASGTLEALLSWTDRERVLTMYLGDGNTSEATAKLAQSSPASNTSARMSTAVQNRTYFVFVEQVGGGPCVMFTLTLTYPQ